MDSLPRSWRARESLLGCASIGVLANTSLFPLQTRQFLQARLQCYSIWQVVESWQRPDISPGTLLLANSVSPLRSKMEVAHPAPPPPHHHHPLATIISVNTILYISRSRSLTNRRERFAPRFLDLGTFQHRSELRGKLRWFVRSSSLCCPRGCDMCTWVSPISGVLQ